MVTFTEHLAIGLRENGFEPRVLKISLRTESKARPGFGPLGYQNVSIAEAVVMARSEPSVLVAVQPKVGIAARVLMDAGAALVVHDPTELKGPLLAALDGPRKITVIRPAILEAVRAAAPSSTVVFCPHPFASPSPSPSPAPRARHAVSFSRIDWDKHTDIIAAANRELLAEQRVEIHGAENRMYTHHKLDSAFPGWREQARGAFPPGGAELLATQARFVVDMSVIAGDGDGTQYTFFEAWAGGAVLIVNRGWLRTGTGAVRDGETALAAANAAELVQHLRDRDAAQEAEAHAPHVRALLREHAAGPCAAAYARGWGWS